MLKQMIIFLIIYTLALLDSMEFSLISNNSLVQSYTTWVIDLLSRNNENRGDLTGIYLCICAPHNIINDLYEDGQSN